MDLPGARSLASLITDTPLAIHFSTWTMTASLPLWSSVGAPFLRPSRTLSRATGLSMFDASAMSRLRMSSMKSWWSTAAVKLKTAACSPPAADCWPRSLSTEPFFGGSTSVSV